MAQKIIPRGKRILVLRDEAESRESEHGIITPENVDREQRAFGTVVAVGPEINDLKKGDRVIYGAYAGETIEESIKGKTVEYKLLDDEDVIAFLK
jgi:chaperonin GroES